MLYIVETNLLEFAFLLISAITAKNRKRDLSFGRGVIVKCSGGPFLSTAIV
jgi:hypothetical protein